ncbi:MAG: ATP-binding protein [Myxococcota bacterium]
MRYRFGRFELDDRLFTLQRDDEVLAVRRQILDLILHLVRERDRVVTKSELHAHLWPDAVVGANSLATAINEARQALGDDGQTRAVIDTVYGRGYRFLLAVEEITDEPLQEEVESASGPLRFGVLSRLFVGRGDVLSRLEGALARAEAGDGRVLLVSGEMGIGKSRTVEELAHRAQRRSIGYVLGRCEGASGAPSFWPWAQVIRQLCEAHSDAQLRDYMGPGASELAQISPEVRERLPGLRPSPRLEGEQARFRLFDSVIRFVGRCAERQPLLLVLEDLHAGDASSLELLRFLARSAPPMRVLVVATYRESELTDDPERTRALGDMTGEPRVERCPLAGLDRQDVAHYVEAAIDAKPSDEVVDELHRRTSGNPFFLHHLVLNVAAAEGVETIARRPESLQFLPATLREAIQGQIERLPDRCQRLLSPASVIGRDFSLGLLEALTEWPREDVLGALQTAIDAGVVEVHPERIAHYRFSHILVRDTLYESLPELARARHHDRARRALESLYGAERHLILTELAHHACQAARLGEEGVALTLALEAARAASARMGHSEAAVLLERALALVELRGAGEAERCDVLVELGGAQTRAGRRDVADATIERATALARALGDEQRLARAVLSLESGFFAIESGHVDRRLIALLEEALAAVAGRAPGLEAHLVARLTQALHWSEDGEARDRMARHAASLGGGTGDAATRMHRASALHGSLWSPERLDERLERAREVIELAESETDWETSLLHRLFLITGLLERGELAAVGRERLAFESLARRIRQPQSAWYPRMFEASDALREGDFDRVEPLAREFVAMARGADDRNAVQSFGCQLTYLRWQTGRLAEVEGFFETLAAQFESFPPWRFARSVILCDLQRFDEARAPISRHWGDGSRPLPGDSSWLGSAVLAAHAAPACASADEIEHLYGVLEPHRSRHAVLGFGVLFWGSVELYLGRLATAQARWDRAEGHFESALGANRAMRARPWCAQTRADWARMLIERNDREGRRRAAGLLDEAAREAAGMGLAILETQVGELQRALG